MGSSESKMTASTALKPEPVIKKTQVSHLIDPRSPSAGIDRTPIQVSYYFYYYFAIRYAVIGNKITVCLS